MKLKILFFGIVAEVIGADTMTETEANTTGMLDENLKKKFPDLNKLNYRIAVNQEIIDGSAEIKEGDEVAFLPPFAGG